LIAATQLLLAGYTACTEFQQFSQELLLQNGSELITHLKNDFFSCFAALTSTVASLKIGFLKNKHDIWFSSSVWDVLAT